MVFFCKKIPAILTGLAFGAFLVMAAPCAALAQNAVETPVIDGGVFPPQAQPETNTVEETSSGDTVTVTEYELPPGEDTHPMIRLTPEKAEIIKLDMPVKSLIVGNPSHLNVLMENTKMLVLVPRDPGATSFTALGEDGKVIMQRHVIVASPKEKYVRVRRSCAAAPPGSCGTTSVYYCPDMCHPVGILGAERGQEAAASGFVGGGAAAGGGAGATAAAAGGAADLAGATGGAAAGTGAAIPGGEAAPGSEE